ncbi:MAG: hypothetical protein WC254_05860, partial [Candidatus Woesearchaeota archaeon]
QTDETIILGFNETSNETTISESEIILTNETIETSETTNTTNETISEEVNETVSIVCSVEQCDVGCAVCRDESCYAPEVGCTEKISIEKISPVTMSKGEQQLNILIKNTGNVALPYIESEVVGYGVTTLEKMPIELLAAGDKDYTFTKINVAESGSIDLIVKLYVNQTMISQEIFQITVAEDIISEQAEETVFNTTATTEQLDVSKKLYDELEQAYYEKEKQEYILYGTKEDLSDVKEALRLAQVAIIEQNKKEFDKNMIYATTTLNSIKQQLESAQKEKKTLWQIMYENLAIIGSILGVLISVITVWSITKVHLKKTRIINIIKGKQVFNLGKKEDVETILDNEPKKDSTKKSKDL